MIKKISIPSDKLLLFGGVYSNLQALEKLLFIAQQKGFSPNEIICTGDIVGYCAQPEECVAFIKKWNIHSIIGNVEEQLREKAEDCGCDFNEGSRCDVFSKQWYPYAQKKVSSTSLQWMQELPNFLTFEFGGKKAVVVHGSFSNISQFIFKSTPWEVKANELQSCSADLIIAGHSGLPFSQCIDNKWWINPGVIGMPANDGSTDVWYAELRLNHGRITVSHCSFSYDHITANQLMTNNQLPSAYSKTLLNGIWDNCEILPTQETLAQGKAIVFN